MILICPRPHSIKTRIKTNHTHDGRCLYLHRELDPLKQGLRLPFLEQIGRENRCPRQYSIRTRIKTRSPRAETRAPKEARAHIPSEQGLGRFLLSLGHLLVRDNIPLKQGLRLCHRPGESSEQSHVRDHIPLKQGLRQVLQISVFTADNLSETIFH